MRVVNLAERIRRGEIAIAAAKARGRDVTSWEQHLETLKREAIAQELPPRTWFAEEIRDEVDTLRAVVICSAVLEDQFWLIIDRAFKPQATELFTIPRNCANSEPRPQNSYVRFTRSSSPSLAAG